MDRTPKTIRTYQGAIRRFLAWLEENEIRRPDRTDILRYKKYLISEGYEATTIQTYLTAVRILFEYLDCNGLYPNVARRVRADKVSREPKKDYLTSDQAAELLCSINRNTSKGLRDYAIIALTVCCGLRTVEISRANVKDFRKREGKHVLYIQGKGRADRTEFVIVPKEAAEAISEYLKDRGRSKGIEPLFPSVSNHNLGGRMSTESISRMIKGYMISIGLDSDRVTAHSLRHTAATLALEQGATLEEVQQSMRHKKTETTLIYIHCLERANNSCSGRVASAIFGGTG